MWLLFPAVALLRAHREPVPVPVPVPVPSPCPPPDTSGVASVDTCQQAVAGLKASLSACEVGRAEQTAALTAKVTAARDTWQARENEATAAQTAAEGYEAIADSAEAENDELHATIGSAAAAVTTSTTTAAAFLQGPRPRVRLARAAPAVPVARPRPALSLVALSLGVGNSTNSSNSSNSSSWRGDPETLADLWLQCTDTKHATELSLDACEAQAAADANRHAVSEAHYKTLDTAAASSVDTLTGRQGFATSRLAAAGAQAERMQAHVDALVPAAEDLAAEREAA